MLVAEDPKTRAVPTQDFYSGMPPIAEDKQSARARVFAQTFRHQRVQAIETLAHVARLDGHEHLEAAGKAQHGFSRARTRAAASGIWLASLISNLAPPGRCTTSNSAAGATTASSKRIAGLRAGRFTRR